MRISDKIKLNPFPQVKKIKNNKRKLRLKFINKIYQKYTPFTRIHSH